MRLQRSVLLILGLGCWPVCATDCIKPGEICRLTSERVIVPTLDWVPTAIDIKADEELRKALRANDKEGLIELLKTGRLLDTQCGDGLRVLDVSVWNNRTEARMTNGKHKGKRVWVVMKWVVK